jgi:SnoaL-like domain
MRTVAVVAVTVALATGCTTPSAVVAERPRGSAKAAVKETRSLIDEAYRSMREGSPADGMGLMSPDLFFIGPGPDDVGLDRAAAIELASKFIDDRKKHKLKSYGLEVSGGPDGHSAWATDQVDYDGVAYTVSIVAAEVDGSWALTTIEVSRAIGSRKLDGGPTLGELPRWQPSDDAGAAHSEAPKEMITAMELASEDVEARLTQFGKASDAAFVGPSPDDVILGSKAINKRWKKRAPTWAISSTVAGASPDGGLVWIVANADKLESPDSADDRDRKPRRRNDDDQDDRSGERDDRAPAAPRRLFALYRNDGAWSLTYWHESVAEKR